MTAKIKATAYLLPSGEGLTLGATPSSPAPRRATPASATSSSTRARARRGDHRSRAMSFLRNLLADLVEKRLWPVAVGARRGARRRADAARRRSGAGAGTPAPVAGAQGAAPSAPAPGRAQVALETDARRPPDHDGTQPRPVRPAQGAQARPRRAKVGADLSSKAATGDVPTREHHAAQGQTGTARAAAATPPPPARAAPQQAKPGPKADPDSTAWTSRSARPAR